MKTDHVVNAKPFKHHHSRNIRRSSLNLMYMYCKYMQCTCTCIYKYMYNSWQFIIHAKPYIITISYDGVVSHVMRHTTNTPLTNILHETHSTVCVLYIVIT